jgi:8-oxo-dGTP pyrophosphatase MutT (NUDIX family)
MTELWDLYDENRQPLGRTHARGVPLEKGTFHLVVEIWVITDDGHILIDQRQSDKYRGGLWECTGGAVIAGEDMITGAQRELREELGIEAEIEKLQLIYTYKHDDFFVDTYVLMKNIDLEALNFQEDEVTDAKLVMFNELISLQEKGQLAEDDARFNAYRDVLREYAEKTSRSD